MHRRITIALLALFFYCIIKPTTLSAQTGKGLDAVSISKSYYNSIVKILLYDSAAAKISPDQAYVGRGSGFFVSNDGYIFTNRHVIDFCKGYCRYITYNKDEKKEEPNIDIYSPSLLNDPSLVKITYAGKTSVIVQVYNNTNGSSYSLYYAKVVVMDTANFDGAILKIVSDLKGNPVENNFHPVPIGNSDSTEQGQDLCLYGFPAQINGSFDLMLKDLSTLIFGKHSGFDYNINSQYGLIKTDAAINSGNSGGPVFGPSNNVIGIATAAFEKTNVGLISGINGMYDLVALLPDLKKELLAKGFAIPQHKPTISTAIFFKPSILPTSNIIKAVNNTQTGNKAANSIQLSFGLCSELPHNETHSIEAFTGNGAPTPSPSLSTTTNGGKSFAIPTSSYGLSIQLTTRNILKNQEKNMFCGLYRVRFMELTMNWNAPNLYTTPFTQAPYNTTFQMYSSIKSFSFSQFLGLTYSHVLSNGVIIGVYYGFGMSTDDISDLAIGEATSNGQTNPITYRSSNVILLQIMGLNIKYKSWFVDIAYSFYTENLEYTLPYYYDSKQSLFYNDYFVTGSIKRNPLYLTLGYTLFFYPRKH
jgi:hypothetical protein